MANLARGGCSIDAITEQVSDIPESCRLILVYNPCLIDVMNLIPRLSADAAVARLEPKIQMLFERIRFSIPFGNIIMVTTELARPRSRYIQRVQGRTLVRALNRKGHFDVMNSVLARLNEFTGRSGIACLPVSAHYCGDDGLHLVPRAYARFRPLIFSLINNQ